MKITSLFRTLTAYTVTPSSEDESPFNQLAYLSDVFDTDDEKTTRFIATDPEGGQEATIGFTPINSGLPADGYFRDIDGSGVLCFIQIAKRSLPTRVVRDQAEKDRATIEDQTGRKMGRKEFRELMEDARFALLPRAFVNRVRIPVILTSDNRLFVFTGTSKHLDAITSLLVEFFLGFGISFSLHHPGSNVSVEGWMTAMATDADGAENITPTDFAVMKGEESAQIRIVNRDLDFEAVRDALKAGYRVKQIGLRHTGSGITFRLSDSMTLRQIDFSDDAQLELASGNVGEYLSDLHALTWLAIAQYRALWDDLMADINGSMTTDEEDDEL